MIIHYTYQMFEDARPHREILQQVKYFVKFNFNDEFSNFFTALDLLRENALCIITSQRLRRTFLVHVNYGWVEFNLSRKEVMRMDNKECGLK